MDVAMIPTERRVERPGYALAAAGLEVVTAALAIPVGWQFITDPTGGSMGVPQSWIAGTVFGSYLVPGLYLLLVNGFGMLIAAALTARRHWAAPWLTGMLGVGMIIWIAVQVVVMPETMFLQAVFLAVGVALGFAALFWLRRTGQLRIW